MSAHLIPVVRVTEARCSEAVAGPRLGGGRDVRGQRALTVLSQRESGASALH